MARDGPDAGGGKTLAKRILTGLAALTAITGAVAALLENGDHLAKSIQAVVDTIFKSRQDEAGPAPPPLTKGARTDRPEVMPNVIRDQTPAPPPPIAAEAEQGHERPDVAAGSRQPAGQAAGAAPPDPSAAMSVRIRPGVGEPARLIARDLENEFRMRGYVVDSDRPNVTYDVEVEGRTVGRTLDGPDRVVVTIVERSPKEVRQPAQEEFDWGATTSSSRRVAERLFDRLAPAATGQR